jgi:hypothetical protein
VHRALRRAAQRGQDALAACGTTELQRRQDRWVQARLAAGAAEDVSGVTPTGPGQVQVQTTGTGTVGRRYELRWTSAGWRITAIHEVAAP